MNQDRKDESQNELLKKQFDGELKGLENERVWKPFRPQRERENARRKSILKWITGRRK